ncbi:PREDICTED: CLAVATA3/ESR (CLE)-related protein 41 [Tarenaya hassleriana]|uniref:CLAVATA3/ESR (CLE)-related protein 41 n=1 Tax=Tarenaya hassleriana TaxID=28532 RepID=UPI00053C709A|nr:PREDICTED: CLAVATA3/ESR (CLE)-related protein 41 [Tarenaya hassleriana]XP_010532884.1 PREDICTED: CLAVATA3/ESR (CLE)-related protein 41 [Tarenaya hassleriana]
MATSNLNYQTNTKSNSVVLLLLLLTTLIFLFLRLFVIISPTNPITRHQSSYTMGSMAIPASPFKRVLLESSTPVSSTMDLHPNAQTSTRQARASSSSTSKRRDQFGADAHEVPSGPNPISN